MNTPGAARVVEVLGLDGTECREALRAVQTIVRESGLDVQVTMDVSEERRAELGATRSPNVVMNGRIMLAGKVPTEAELRLLFGAELYDRSSGPERVKQSRELFNPAHVVLDHAFVQALADDVVEHVLYRYCFEEVRRDFDHEVEIVRALPPGVRMVFTTVLVDGEVQNGGFAQCLWNSTRMYLTEALAGFTLIGAHAHADILRDVITFCEREGMHPDRSSREVVEEVLERPQSDATTSSFDERYYALTEDLTRLRLQFVRAHPEAFAASWALD